MQRTRALKVVAKTPHKVLEYAASQDNFGEHSAHELGLDPTTVLKTLVVANVQDPKKLALCCVPVSGHLSLKAAAKALGWKKAAMAELAQAEHATGYVVGGISPLGTLKRLPVLLDATIESLDAITVSAGQRGLSVQLAPGDLAKLTSGKFAPIGA